MLREKQLDPQEAPKKARDEKKGGLLELLLKMRDSENAGIKKPILN